jgi:hypothetical protein
MTTSPLKHFNIKKDRASESKQAQENRSDLGNASYDHMTMGSKQL